MKNMLVVALCLVSSLAFAGEEDDPPIVCDPQDEPPSCQVSGYPATAAAGGGGEDLCEELPPVCLPIDDAIDPGLKCDVKEDVVSCVAWPQTVDDAYPITYRWQGSYGNSLGSNSNDWTLEPEAVFDCSARLQPLTMVTVSIRSPYGLISSTSALIYCGRQRF